MAVSVSASIENYTSSNDVLLNPERGLYYPCEMTDEIDFEDIRRQGYTLCYSSIIIKDFLSDYISLEFLAETQCAFEGLRKAGLKGIVRIIYENNSGGKDANLKWMEIHLQHLQPILQENSDVIAWFQAGLIGAWGEWHASTNKHHENPKPVWDLMLKYFPSDKFIAIRTPRFVNKLEGLNKKPLTDEEAFSGTPRARITHHNDCWVASDTDTGTYPEDPNERAIEKKQISHDTKFAPWGGETCSPSDRSNCETAVAEAKRFHATYLNTKYHPDVIQEFKDGGCWESEFVNKLGYRFELLSSEFPDTISACENLTFTIKLKNVGWAPVYNPRPVLLRVLCQDHVIAEYRLTKNADPRRWLPEKGIIILHETVKAPQADGDHEISFAICLPDNDENLKNRPEFSIRFANPDVWDDNSGHNILSNNCILKSNPVDKQPIRENQL
ncbi:MAG: DUF4832 domain-containing protein [Candidatus Cloacimonetes bacterium]|nr:DUF4832 domain-containing protein [Candidatus Cloacimonadota bacterium]